MASAVRTRITSLFGCKYPLLLPGMSWISDPKLVAAVSNAGGVGILATGPLDAAQTRAAIRDIRSQTDQPFGIGATLLMPGAKENAEVALDEQVPVMNRMDRRTSPSVRRQGAGDCDKCKARPERNRIGGRCADANGARGGRARGDVTSLVLVPSISKRFPDIPLVAAGGFADGRGLAAALSLGADAVAMGSRFAVTKESSLAQSMKEIISQPDSTESDTLYGKNFDGIPARVLKSEESLRLMKRPASLPVVVYRAFNAASKMNIPLWKVIPGLVTQWQNMYMIAQFGAATESLMKATVDGNHKEGVQFISQGMGLINDIPAVDELVRRIIAEALDASSQSVAALSGDTDASHRRAA